MDSRLELRLADASPKCATCARYERDVREDKGVMISYCRLWDAKVLDLAVCTSWTERLELEAVKE